MSKRQIASHGESAKRYAVLRFIGAIFTGLGTLLVTAGSLLLAFGLYALMEGWLGRPPGSEVPFAARPINVLSFPGSLGGALSALWSFGCLISGLQFLALGAVCRLLIDVEENTRKSAQCLERISSREEPIEQNVASFFRS